MPNSRRKKGSFSPLDRGALIGAGGPGQSSKIDRHPGRTRSKRVVATTRGMRVDCRPPIRVAHLRQASSPRESTPRHASGSRRGELAVRESAVPFRVTNNESRAARMAFVPPKGPPARTSDSCRAPRGLSRLGCLARRSGRGARVLGLLPATASPTFFPAALRLLAHQESRTFAVLRCAPARRPPQRACRAPGTPDWVRTGRRLA